MYSQPFSPSKTQTRKHKPPPEPMIEYAMTLPLVLCCIGDSSTDIQYSCSQNSTNTSGSVTAQTKQEGIHLLQQTPRQHQSISNSAVD